MTDRERFERNARNNGIDTFTVNKPQILSWSTLNNEFQITHFFDENGKYTSSKTIQL